MSLETMPTDRQEEIVSALEAAVASIAAGSPPDDAIRKEAEARGYGPPVVRLMCEAVNIGRTRRQLETAPSGAKSASFDLADPEKISAAMYPIRKAAVALHDFPTREDVDFFSVSRALPPLPGCDGKMPVCAQDPYAVFETEHRRRSELEKAASDAARDHDRVFQEELFDLAAGAAAHFLQNTRVPFAEVEKRAAHRFGKASEPLMNTVWSLTGLENRPAALPAGPCVWPGHMEPYATLDKMAAAVEGAGRKVELWMVAESAFSKAAGVQPGWEKKAAVQAPPAAAVEEFAKEAIIDLKPMSLDLGAGASEGISALGLREPGDAPSGIDPAHEAELNGIKTRAMLNDFISNDEVLRTYPAEHVTEAYRRIAGMAPEVAKHPPLMRNMLRKELQRDGAMETFDAREMTTLDQQLRDLSARSTEAV